MRDEPITWDELTAPDTALLQAAVRAGLHYAVIGRVIGVRAVGNQAEMQGLPHDSADGWEIIHIKTFLSPMNNPD